MFAVQPTMDETIMQAYKLVAAVKFGWWYDGMTYNGGVTMQTNLWQHYHNQNSDISWT